MPLDEEPYATAQMAADERIHGEVVRGLAARGRRRLSGTFRAAVFGANDGLVSNLALVMGIGATGVAPQLVLFSGIAGLLAGALSMGAGEFVSVRSQRELLDATQPDSSADEVLPDLHAALIMLGQGDDPPIAQARELLATAHRQTAALLRGLPARPPVRPSGHLLDDLRRLVEEEMASRFDAVQFGADAAAAACAERLRPLSAEVIFYAVRELVRNAERHGRGGNGGPLTLAVTVTSGEGLTVRVQDNGVGGPAQAADGGAGQGLALHAAMLAVVGATLAVQPVPEGGIQATIQVVVG